MNQEVFLAYLHSHKTPLLDILGPRLYRPKWEISLRSIWKKLNVLMDPCHLYPNILQLMKSLFDIPKAKHMYPFRSEPACMGVVASIFFVKHSLTYSRGIWSLYTNCTILFSMKWLFWIILNVSFLKLAFFLLRSFKKKS